MFMEKGGAPQKKKNMSKVLIQPNSGKTSVCVCVKIFVCVDLYNNSMVAEVGGGGGGGERGGKTKSPTRPSPLDLGGREGRTNIDIWAQARKECRSPPPPPPPHLKKHTHTPKKKKKTQQHHTLSEVFTFQGWRPIWDLGRF